MLLGVTGDQVLPADVYQEIKTKTLNVVRGTVQADILKRRSGPEYLYLLYGICAEING
jgi:hypothetical protein